MSSGGALSSSLTDMMTSLMVIFILLLVNFIKEENDTTNEFVDRTKLIKHQLEQNCSIDFPEIKVQHDPKDPFTLVVIVPKERLRFETNSAALNPSDVEFLTHFIPKFVPVICSEDYLPYLSSVVVEGHADPRGSDSLNLKLSQDRSFEVMKFIVEHSESDQTCFLSLSSASGRGESAPVMVQDVIDNDLSRRVEFRIRVKSHRAYKLEKSISQDETQSVTPKVAS